MLENRRVKSDCSHEEMERAEEGIFWDCCFSPFLCYSLIASSLATSLNWGCVLNSFIIASAQRAHDKHAK
jgi:hypothetical protein